MDLRSSDVEFMRIDFAVLVNVGDVNRIEGRCWDGFHRGRRN
jgi:hypothetical protein